MSREVGWVRAALAGVLLLFGVSAAGQTVEQPPLDLHGLVPPPPASDPAAPLLIWSPPDDVRSVSVGLLGEGAHNTAERWVDLEPQDPDEGEELAGRMGAVAALNLGARIELIPRLGLGLSLPVFLFTQAEDVDLETGGLVGGGPALGDLSVALPIGLVPLDADGGLGLGLVPRLSLPTGAQERFLGDPGATAGLIVAGSLGRGSWRTDLNLGVAYSGLVQRATQRFGGLELPLGIGLGLRLADRTWIGLEGRSNVGLSSGQIQAGSAQQAPGFSPLGAPAELFVSLRTGGAGSSAALAGGRSVVGGIGAANARGFLGVGYSWRDDPEAPILFTVRVLGPDGVPIGGAEVVVGRRKPVRTDAAGEVVLAEVPWAAGVVVRAEGYQQATVPEPAPGVSQTTVRLAYDATPLPLQVRVVDQEGQPVEATLRAEPVDGGEPIEGPVGQLILPRGQRYRIVIDAPGLGAQVREVEVDAAGRLPTPFEVVLLPEAGDETLSARLLDPEGEPVVGARILIDGLPVGTTADGGVFDVSGLAPGGHALEIQHPEYTTAILEGFGAGGAEGPIVLQRSPGSVRITVQGPDGEIVPDAVARFLGPRRLPPMPLGERGQRVQVLGPGSWVLLVSSEAYGIQERVLEVPRDSWELIEVTVVLQGQEAGEAMLNVQVIDPSGRPVDGARIELDGLDLGATSTGGTLALSGLEPGPRVLSVSADRMRPIPPQAFALSPGAQDRVIQLEWEAGQVDVIARSPDGLVADAVVRFLGPVPVEPLPLDEGRSSLSLRPGSWTVLVTSERLGAQQRSLVIEEDTRRLHRVEFLLVPDEGGGAQLSVEVLDPEGVPVEHARVLLDGIEVGSTSNTGTLQLSDLSMGSRTIEVQAEAFLPASTAVRLEAGEHEAQLRLRWGPGAVRVRVVHDGEIVPDAVLRFLGASRRWPRPVDASGQVTAVLEPGSWVLLATSEAVGVGEHTIEIPEAPGLTEAQVELTEAGAGLATLTIKVQDPSGRLIEGVKLTLDGAPLGGGEDGVVVWDGLPMGSVQLEVSAANHQTKDVQLVLSEEAVVYTAELDWVPVALNLQTQLEDGSPVGATIQLEGGPEDIEAVRTGSGGAGAVYVPPGTWTIVATSGELAATAQQQVVLGQAPTDVVLVLTETSARVTGQAVALSERVQFDFDKATLRPDSAPVLQAVAQAIRSRPGIIRVEIQGHTDNIGSLPVNQQLSELRADAVRLALIELGIAPERLEARGYGTQRPLTSNETQEGRATNRRVQFEILEQAPLVTPDSP